MHSRMSTPNEVKVRHADGRAIADVIFALEEGEFVPVLWQRDLTDPSKGYHKVRNKDGSERQTVVEGPCVATFSCDVGECNENGVLLDTDEEIASADMPITLASIKPLDEKNDPYRSDLKVFSRRLWSIERTLVEEYAKALSTTRMILAIAGKGVDDLRSGFKPDWSESAKASKLSTQLVFAAGQEFLPFSDEYLANWEKENKNSPLRFSELEKLYGDQTLIIINGENGPEPHTFHSLRERVTDWRAAIEQGLEDGTSHAINLGLSLPIISIHNWNVQKVLVGGDDESLN